MASLGKGKEASCCGGSAVCLMGGTEAGISGGAVVGNNRVYPLRLPSIETSPHMNELKGRHGLKQESLIYFQRANLHTALSGNPKHLVQTLGITFQAQEGHGDFLYSLIYKGGGVIQWWWSITTNGG